MNDYFTASIYRITLFLFPVFILMAGCSEDEPEASSCETDFSGLEIDKTAYAYTGDTLHISGKSFCETDEINVLIDEIKTEPIQVTTTKLSFIVPKGSEDTVTIKIQNAETTITLVEKLPVFTGGGAWVEVAPFPASGRDYTNSASYNGNGYVVGGTRYLGHTEESGYIYEFLTDLYEYSEENNSWTLVKTDNRLTSIQSFTGMDGSLFFTPNSISKPFFRLDLDAGIIEELNSVNSGTILSNLAFTAKEQVYACVAIRDNGNFHSLSISKYNIASDVWENYSSIPYDNPNNSAYINFCLVRDNEVYIGYNPLNSDEVVLGAFDIETKAYREISRIEVFVKSFPALTHLFTIDELAYFIETGGSTVGPGYSFVEAPGDHLFIFNFKNETWRIQDHTYPESFFSVAAFTINNRGFAGLSVSEASPSFDYSQKFYEFLPE